MPFSLFNKVVSWMLKKRIHQIELFMKYPHDVQSEVLKKLITQSKDTLIGKEYDFKSINNYNDFSKRIPARTYEEFFAYINKTIKGEQNVFWNENIKWFAQSSGTTNSKSKFIPVSNSALENCHFKAGKDMLCLYINNNENSSIFSGKSLRLGGSRKIYENNNNYFGDLSAILIDNLPLWAEIISTPNNSISLMDKWDEKIEAIIEGTLNEDVRSLAGVPSWMLTLLNKLLEKTGKTYIDEIWSNLEVYFHGGVSFNPYKNEFKNIISNNEFKFYEIYNASEGFFAIQDSNDKNDLLLMLDYGIFYEFIEINEKDNNEKIIDLSSVELGLNYEILITTNSGLWRYKIGDTVKFTSLNPYRIIVSGRTKHFINAFGEEVIIDNVENALEEVIKIHQCKIIDYTVAPKFMKSGKKGKHEWIIEFSKEPNNIKQFIIDIDTYIQKVNSDYKAKRYLNITLDIPKIYIARENLFYDWLKRKNKVGGQNKIPRLSNNRIFFDELLSIN
tara:strand:- start:2001 stop:3509 length:1509 start_codon:yes stop_codon:yes gene_type:complete